jgi:hypothetical protein
VRNCPVCRASKWRRWGHRWSGSASRPGRVVVEATMRLGWTNPNPVTPCSTASSSGREHDRRPLRQLHSPASRGALQQPCRRRILGCSANLWCCVKRSSSGVVTQAVDGRQHPPRGMSHGSHADRSKRLRDSRGFDGSQPRTGARGHGRSSNELAHAATRRAS